MGLADGTAWEKEYGYEAPNLKPITTWYKKKLNGDYFYSHFTYGHISKNKKDMLHKNCYLDTSSEINKVKE